MPGHSPRIVCVPIGSDCRLGPSWGRADRVAVAIVSDDGIDDWQEFDVGWGTLHDSGTEGSHHARIARFLLEQSVEAVAAQHMGPGMTHMLAKMGLTVRLGEEGNAKAVAARLLTSEPDVRRDATTP
jgi:predicted Fe-Mo cluster-binding NifX family protein